MIDRDLIALRAQYDAGSLSDRDFIREVNALLANAAATMTADEKIRRFDQLVGYIAGMFIIEDLDGGMTYVDSDNTQYVFEKATGLAFGDLVFDFINDTYQC